MAVELLQSISTNEDERARFRARRKFRMDTEHNIAAAQDEKAMEIAKNALEAGLTIETIARITGLTSVEVKGLSEGT